MSRYYHHYFFLDINRIFYTNLIYSKNVDRKNSSTHRYFSILITLLSIFDGTKMYLYNKRRSHTIFLRFNILFKSCITS